MQKSLVWSIIQGFSKKEKKAFRQFLDSPYFNTRTDLKFIFEQIVQYQSSNEAAPSREKFFKKVFSDKNFDDQKLRLAMSYLLKLLETFLILESNKSDDFQNQQSLLAAYRNRNLHRHFQKTINRSQKYFQTQTLRHPEYHYSKFLIENENYHFLSGSGRTKEMNLQEVENQLNEAFLSMKLRQACFLRSHEMVFNATYDIALLDEILETAADPKYEEVPAVAIYYYCFKALFQSEQEADFQLFKNRLFEYTPKFPKSEIRDLHILVINYCIRKLNEGKVRFQRETLELYQNGLENELLLENGRLSHFTFNNIAGIAVRIGEYNWVEDFMHRYKSFLNPSYQEITFSHNAAKLEHARKNYDLALQYLQKADYKDLINNMAAKTLQMKIFYEMGEDDLLHSHLNTMSTFIRRNKKKMGYHHQTWTNIVRYTKKLADLNHYDKAAKASLKEAIEREDILPEKAWLLGQLG